MKVVAFDISGIFWQAALGGAGKDDIEAPYRITCETVQSLSSGFDRVVLAIDAAKSFRNDIYPPYKSHRPERVEWQWNQLKRAVEWLETSGCIALVCDNFEADDVLMTVAAWCAANNTHCTVVSNDKDLAAVLGCGPDVSLVKKNSKTGVWETRTAEQFEATMGFKPYRMPEYLALMGDTADEFNFFDGIGDVTARKILQAYPTLNAVYDAAWACANEGAEPFKVKLQAKQLTALRAEPTVYDLALRLATPRHDVPLYLAPLESADPPSFDVSGRTDDDADGPSGAAKTNAAIVEAPAHVEASGTKASTAMALATRDTRYELAPYSMQPETLDDAWRLAKLTIGAAIMPQWGRPEQVAMVIMAARERQIPAFTALQNAHVVKGKVGWSAALLAAMVLADPTCEYFEIVETTHTKATVASKQQGRPEKRLTYTIEEARQAGLFEKDGQWQKRPATMLRWAAFREAARAFWPHRTTGMFTPGELRERFDDVEMETAGEIVETKRATLAEGA